jgi:hypothetical protein
MFNFPAGAEVISAAPIGDRSVYVYSGAWGGLTPNINSCDGELFTLSNMSGAPTGVHLYYVNNFPNDVSGLSGTGTYDRYFGVHKIGDPTATYTATYNYTGNPYINTSNEPTVELYRRPDNATFPWVNTFGTLNIAANTIQATGQNTEFIIDYDFSPLPVELVTFSGYYDAPNDNSFLNWETSTELNNDYFSVYRSIDGVQFDLIGTIDGQGNSNQATHYQFIDILPRYGVNYYMLKQHDFDGETEELGIISILKNGQSDYVIYPNPVNVGGKVNVQMNSNVSESVRISVYDNMGKRVKELDLDVGNGINTIQFDLPNHIKEGTYIVSILGETSKSQYRLIVY